MVGMRIAEIHNKISSQGVPLVHTSIWLAILLIKKEGKLERCLGSYYLEIEFWILDGPRMAQLIVNIGIKCGINLSISVEYILHLQCYSSSLAKSSRFSFQRRSRPNEVSLKTIL
jgi:hypothetical protein